LSHIPRRRTYQGGASFEPGVNGLNTETIALLRKVRHRGTLKVDWIFTFACAAYHMVRMRNLMAAAVSAQ
jgi:hypothetical protein